MTNSCENTTAASAPGLVRRLGLFHATMIVMGGIVGSGIFMNPYVVAQQVHTPFLILAAWVAGGAIALTGAFIYGELAARRLARLADARHPATRMALRMASLASSMASPTA